MENLTRKIYMDTNTSLKRNYQDIPDVPPSVWKNPLHFIAFGFGVGAIPFAPGTFGTLIAIPFYLVLQLFSWKIYIIVLIIATIASIWICDRVSKEMNVDDHQGMCLDEVIGFLWTMVAVPYQWRWLVLGFILFRIFDIWKPGPLRYVDNHIHGGFGMILDDVLAGLMSCGILHTLMHLMR